jgi:hypothetical protein
MARQADTVISCAPTSIDNLLRDDISTKTALHINVRPPSPLAYHHNTNIFMFKPAKPGKLRPRQRTQEWVATQPSENRNGVGWLEPASPIWQDNDERGGRIEHISPETNNRRPLNVHQNIFRYLHQTVRAQIKSPYELASLITNQYANVFADHDVPAEYQFFDFFERSIGNVVCIPPRQYACQSHTQSSADKRTV